jgi:hypothetical protein
MQNKIDAVLTAENRDRILDLTRQIFELLPFRIDLTPEERQSFIKMGDWGRPFVEQTLTLAEQNDSFLPRSFSVPAMRKDKDLFEAMSPVNVQILRLADAVRDIMIVTGNDLILGAYDIYGNAKENGQGEHLDNLVPLVAQRFKRKSKKVGGDDSNQGEAPPG